MSFRLQLRAAIVGDLDKEVADGLRRVTIATRAALDDYAASLQSKLRQDLASSRLARGAELQKTWRRRLYPNTGLDPAALVWSTMPAVVRAFEDGAVVTVNGKKGALYPNPEVWGGRVRRPSGRGGKSTSTFDVALRRFGKLQFLPSKAGGKSVGVFVATVDRAGRAQGKFRKAGVRARSKGLVDKVVVFFVLAEPRLPKLLRGDVIRGRVAADFPGDFGRRFDAHLARLEAGQPPPRLTFQGDS